jgi:hypothetical protein
VNEISIIIYIGVGGIVGRKRLMASGKTALWEFPRK